MYPLELIRSVRLITDVCLEVAPGENVLCIVDGEENMEVATLIAAECTARGAEPAVVLLEPRKATYHEPPRTIARAMKEADIVISMQFGNLMHTKARREACAAGAKYANITALNKEHLGKLNLTKEDLLEVRAFTEKLVKLLTEASSAHVTTRAGTDLRMSLKGRPGVGLIPFGRKGTFCSLPVYAEAACAPIEESVQGVAVVDGSMAGDAKILGLVEQPFEIRFENGRITRISEGRDAAKVKSLLEASGDEVRTFAQLGLNSNYKLPKKLTGTKFDNGIGGHIHFGLGRNDHIGGKSTGDVHVDLLMTSATVALDGKLILEDGNFRIGAF